MKSDNDRVQALARQLEQLAAEHELYQQTELGGAHDPEWCRWYGRRLRETDLGGSLSEDDLCRRLEDGFALFSAHPNHSLPELLAEQILKDSSGTE